MNATVGRWPSGRTVCFTPVLFSKVLNAKHGKIACTIFQVFGMKRPGIEPRPTAYKASILPLDLGHGRSGLDTTLIRSILDFKRSKNQRQGLRVSSREMDFMI